MAQQQLKNNLLYIFFLFKLRNQQQGFVMLTAVLLLTIIGTTIAVSLLITGTDATRTAFSLVQSQQAKGLSVACAEEALEKIVESTSFVGTATIPLGQGSCTYLITNTGGTTRTITASATVGTIVQKVTILLTQVSPITVSSWQEMP